MKIFDFNIHLPVHKDQDVNIVIQEDLTLDINGLIKNFSIQKKYLEQISGGNFMLFNQELFNRKEGFDILNNTLKNEFSKYSLTALIDFRRKDIFDYISNAKFCGLNFVMVNSYLQKIEESDYESVYKAFSFAAENKIKICIDASYGTSKMFTYDNLKLACYIADKISQVPIVIIHSGGRRVLDAMWLAIDKANIYFDTSFTLPYYIGSSIEQDMAFAFRNMGTHRVLYGSDFPYENSDKALDIHLKFFEKFKFSSSDIENIIFNNAIQLLNE